jgi:putative transposase
MRRACRLLQTHWNSYYYQPRPDRNVEIRKRLKELADQRRRFGSRRLHVLLNREGYEVNHKRIERLYREEGLSLRRRKRKRVSHIRLELPKVTRPN